MFSGEITAALRRWNDGHRDALDEVTPLVYEELHRLAARYLRSERPDHTLQATALVHEAYLEVRAMDNMEWNNRAHFVAVAARTMRRILVGHARQHRALKRGGGNRVPMELDQLPGPERDLDLIELDDALDRFAKEYPRQAQVVELRYFGGLTAEETAEVLSADHQAVSLRTVERDWRFARAWLQQAMAPGLAQGAAGSAT